jgi:hypothetical protein
VFRAVRYSGVSLGKLMPTCASGQIKASDPKVDSTFGIDPMLFLFSGTSFGAENLSPLFADAALRVRTMR